MKIYFIDKTGKNEVIKKLLEKEINIEIDTKQDTKFRINKTDYVITTDNIEDYENYKKISNLIIITNKENKNDIWKMATCLNTKDIISMKNVSDEYIANRIAREIMR